MTLAADDLRTAHPVGRSAPTARVWAVVHVGPGDLDPAATLRAVSAGSTVPHGVVVLDGSGTQDRGAVPDRVTDPVRRLADDLLVAARRLGRDEEDEPEVHLVPVDPRLPARYAFNLLLRPDTCPPVADATHLWFLDATTVPDRTCLERLLHALGSSPSTALAGPKLLAAPGRLRGVGIVATRSGRVLADPEVGQHDQGQFDSRADVLAVPAAGLLLEAGAWRELGGFPVRFGGIGADLDLSWRAHRAGHRVAVVPAATALAGPTLGASTPSTGLDRRDLRRVALARSGWWTAPFLALWLAVSSVVSGLGLVLLKRPRAGLAALGDVGALLAPAASVGGRWAGRRTHAVARRDLRALFARTGDVTRHAGDLVHLAFAPAPRSSADPDAATETGPTESGEDVFVQRRTLAQAFVRSPGLLAAVLAAVVTGFAVRGFGGLRAALTSGGFAGGELPGGRLDPAGLVSSWWTGFGGAGLGSPVEASPAGVLLAGPAWLVSHAPLLEVSSAGGVALAWLLLLSLPLAAASAYLAGRVLTRAPWPRAAVALLWAANPVSLAALGDARVGALVLLLTLPLVLAALARTLHRHGTLAAPAAGALVTTVSAAYAPGVLVPVVAVLLLGLLLGTGGRRSRALTMLVALLVLLGPWAAEVISRPRVLLTGPGLLAEGATVPDRWHLLALSPDHALGGWWWVTAPVGALALAGLWRARHAALQWALGALGVLGLAATFAAPRVRLGAVPEGLVGAGDPVRPWWGAPMLLVWAAALALALLAVAELCLRPSRIRWRAAVRWPVVAVTALVAAGLPVLLAATGAGDALHAWREPRPAIATDQAGPPLSNRTLLLSAEADGYGQRLLAQDAVEVARDLRTPTTEPQLAAAIQAVVGEGRADVSGLRDLGIGYVGVRAPEGSDLPVRLDATDGLVRMGSRQGYAFWRLSTPVAAGGQTSLGVPRVTLLRGGARLAVPTSGAGGVVDTTVTASAGDRVVVAAPVTWAGGMEVRLDGRLLRRTTGVEGVDRPVYVLPHGGRLEIRPERSRTVVRIGQGVAAGCLLVLAIPTGRRRKDQR